MMALDPRQLDQIAEHVALYGACRDTLALPPEEAAALLADDLLARRENKVLRALIARREALQWPAAP